MPKQGRYLLLAKRDSTTEVLKEERNAGEGAKVRIWNGSAISWNSTPHTSSISKMVSHRASTETRNREINPSSCTVQCKQTQRFLMSLLMRYRSLFLSTYIVF
ncbi:MAG: hypothetical protein HYV59_12305 [Planctomycetes bacterium]|nr:hypothetical protein [Planctomycetota bacterium]